MVRTRLPMVPVLSSAARMPLPGVAIFLAFAISSSAYCTCREASTGRKLRQRRVDGPAACPDLAQRGHTAPSSNSVPLLYAPWKPRVNSGVAAAKGLAGRRASQVDARSQPGAGSTSFQEDTNASFVAGKPPGSELAPSFDRGSRGSAGSSALTRALCTRSAQQTPRPKGPGAATTPSCRNWACLEGRSVPKDVGHGESSCRRSEIGLQEDSLGLATWLAAAQLARRGQHRTHLLPQVPHTQHPGLQGCCPQHPSELAQKWKEQVWRGHFRSLGSNRLLWDGCVGDAIVQPRNGPW